MIVACSRLRRMRNVTDQSWRENQNANFVVNNFFVFKVLFVR